jgi:hypothetical protein
MLVHKIIILAVITHLTMELNDVVIEVRSLYIPKEVILLGLVCASATLLYIATT